MKFFKKSDILVILTIILVGAGLWIVYRNFYSSKPAKAEIYYKSQLIKTVALDNGKDETFSIPQNPHVVFHLDKTGTIAFEESDCPDKICVKTGKLSRVGETAACLPNEIILKIVPADNNHDKDDLDMIIGK
jgi:hypothetical protein